MEIHVSTKPIDEGVGDVLIIGKFEDETSADVELVNEILGGVEALESFSGKYKKMKTFSSLGAMHVDSVLVVGLGKKGEFSLERLRRTTGVAMRKAQEDDAKHIMTTLHHALDVPRASAQATAEACILSLYQFTKYKTKTEDLKVVDKVTFLTQKEDAVTKGVRKARILCDAANYVRDLVNTPANEVTPQHLADEAERLGKKYKLKVTVLERKDMEKLGMNALLGVTKGSDQPPKFIVMEKKGKGKPVAIVGKGITFDSGGLSIKPSKYMEDMKIDMSGAATVLGTMRAACELDVNAHLIGVVPTCENMTGGSAQRPGDIVKAFNGKTIEVLNTDAEGRLILADALSYISKEYTPEITIDLATLTGSVMVALGYQAAGLFGNDEKLLGKIKIAAEKTGERVWQLPLYEEYTEWMESDIADLRNISKSPSGREAGSCTAAAFLQEFVTGNWAHFDIAGTAKFEEQREYWGKGATGYGVRLLTTFLEGLQ